MIRRSFNQRWQPGERLLDSPVLGHGVRIVGEDEFRETGQVSAAGDNILFLGRREKVDIEVLEVTLQNQATSTITGQLHLSGYMISGQWQLPATLFWSSPGFILMSGQVLYLRLSSAGQFAFEIRWRLYYGRKK